MTSQNNFWIRILKPSEWCLFLFIIYCGVRLFILGQPPYVLERSVIFPGIEIGVLFYLLSLIKLVSKLNGLRPVRFFIYGLMTLFALSFYSTLNQTSKFDVFNRISAFFLLILLPFVFHLHARLERGSGSQDERIFSGIYQSIKASLSQFVQTIRPMWVLVSLICVYPWMTLILKSAPSADVDSSLAAIDRFLFSGVNPMRIMERIHSDLMSDWMAFCYTLYGLYVTWVIAVLFLREDQRGLKNASVILSLVFVIGYVGYTLFPALGPMYTQKFPFDLHFEYMGQLKTELMDKPRIDRDCFPSLHTAITFVVSWIAWREIRAIFWIFLPITLTMPFACVYLRYHYVADVLAGTILSFGLIALDAWMNRSQEKISHS